MFPSLTLWNLEGGKIHQNAGVKILYTENSSNNYSFSENSLLFISGLPSIQSRVYQSVSKEKHPTNKTAIIILIKKKTDKFFGVHVYTCLSQ